MLPPDTSPQRDDQPNASNTATVVNSQVKAAVKNDHGAVGRYSSATAARPSMCRGYPGTVTT